MSNSKEKAYVLWRDGETGKLIKFENHNNKLVKCKACPCCKPRVIASQITNGLYGPKDWDLRPYQKENIGLPGAKWRIRDVGESHHNNPNASCSGSQYGEGWIDDKGVLVGLFATFSSNYYYNGYMELQMGCVQEDGSVEWPCPNG